MKIFKLNKKLFFSIILGLGILQSCQKVLEEDVYSFIGKENFYKNKVDAESAVIGIYNGLIDNNHVYGRWYYDFVHLMDDQVTIHRNVNFLQMDEFNLQPDNSYLTLFWEGLYSVINRANVAIARIPDIEMNEDEKKSLIAEARFFRASMYFLLVRLWGEVPFIMNEVSDEESAHISKGSIDQIYEGIIEDLEYADENLPDTRPVSKFGRVTKYAAKSTLCEVYLTRENWVAASSKAKEIINSGLFQLEPNFEDIFTESNEGSQEIIHSIVFDGVNYGNWMASFSHAGGTDNANCYNGAQVWQVDDNSEIWKNWSDIDPRKGYSIYTEYLSKSGEYKSVFETSRPYPAFGKYNVVNEANTSACPLNPIIYRYADILLMYAEAESQANGGPNQDAYDAFNLVRRRGFKVPLNEISIYDLTAGLDATSFRDSVILERSHEFVIEGKRLFDLMRTNQFPQKLVDMGKIVRPNAKFLPIPTVEISSNNKLTTADQNLGY